MAKLTYNNLIAMARSLPRATASTAKRLYRAAMTNGLDAARPTIPYNIRRNATLLAAPKNKTGAGVPKPDQIVKPFKTGDPMKLDTSKVR